MILRSSTPSLKLKEMRDEDEEGENSQNSLLRSDEEDESWDDDFFDYEDDSDDEDLKYPWTLLHTGEYDFRHPGTRMKSDDEDSDDEYSRISTKTGRDLGSIILAGAAGTPSCELKSEYKLQLSVRVEKKR